MNDQILPGNLENLARQLTQSSDILNKEVQAYNPELGSQLDPHSPSFNARAWIKAIINLAEGDPQAAPNRFLGVAFKNLSAYGWRTASETQLTVLNLIPRALASLAEFIGASRRNQVDILRNFEGVVEPGELLLVLGPPGSGCSTFLKTLAGETLGFEVREESYLNYRGLEQKQIFSSLRGEVLYNAEVDVHLPHLTVGETLTFAARCHSVRYIPGGFSNEQADNMMRDVMMAIFGIGHTFNTRVGDDFVRGVSGGERKRVSIAEAALSGAKLQCWDNSTRGLDSGNAISFCMNLRTQADLVGVTCAVAIYQAPQAAYEQFDRVILLYEGRQIFFGKTSEAKAYFEGLGFECPDRQTTPDFLTSMTSPGERRAKSGYENKVPRSADEFAERWRDSDARQTLLSEIEVYEAKHPSGLRHAEYEASRRAEQAKSQRARSPYMISYLQQIRLAIWRGYRRLLADPGFTIASLAFNLVIALLLGSMYYNLKPDTSSLYYRGGIVFFALLFNAFASQLEVLTVYAERPIVEKQARYAFYHQSTQAIASYIMDLPYKTINMVVFNLVIYFMANLRREAGAFFFFCLTSYTLTLVMSCLYRWLANITRTAYQAMVPSAVLSLGLIIYTGYTIPVGYLPGWSRWMNYINPFAYAFEALMANEFHGVEFPCAEIVPRGVGYEDLPSKSRVCATVGAIPGSTTVSGDRYLALTFHYYNRNKWRDVGILFAFLAFFFAMYIVAAEYAKPPKSKGEVLVFKADDNKQRHGPPGTGKDDLELQPRQWVDALRGADSDDSSSDAPDHALQMKNSATADVLHWEDLAYTINIKGEERCILDNVDGWVKPGASTALMGVSGAGKTTLLDVLANRVTMGVVSGSTLINGAATDASFQHRVGYVQQQDLHLSTMTVREALEFSALLRQSAEVPREEKLNYVDYVIGLLDMQSFANAVIGTLGEGLNVEQRKRLTIGVELAARPQLLLFLDEPTSGLDSQTSWAICQLIKKLTASGQAVLCTIHQPSALLFDQFDRLLLLAPGGKTVYFGDLGPQSRTVIDYFERNGASKCPAGANQAEWMLDVIKPSTDGRATGIDWHQVWRSSPEFEAMKAQLQRLRRLSEHMDGGNCDDALAASTGEASQHREFVASFWRQFVVVLDRTWKHFWRSPGYIWAKVALIALSALYIGFSFRTGNSMQSLLNQLYAIFMFLVMFNNLNEQIMPIFVPQRALYETRERPSKIYHWATFVLSNILVEAGWNTLMAVIIYFCWYYPIGFVANTTADDRAVRGFIVFLFLWMFMLFTSTFSHFAITWVPNAEIGGVIASLLWMFCLIFCGVSIPKSDFPDFWKWMHPVSPGTYLVGGVMSAAISGADVACSETEILRIQSLSGMSCGAFMGSFANETGGVLLNPTATDVCQYCVLANTDQFLSRFDIYYGDAWRNFGVLWIYIFFNIGAAMGLYWVFRMPKVRKQKQA
ncbi:ABC-2 type transporter-domain-containing protein [Aspergillus pseudoustus]|uniref:ABC-2 type transporter-domain-containing protein n=1 Tax=Aspergillus pseudoustus TaxID=1810923 RepID=A0ABR4IZI6_9EURO